MERRVHGNRGIGVELFEVTGHSSTFQLAYTLSGEGEPVVQLHGLGSSMERTRATGGDLTEGQPGLRVLRIDAPGHGHSAGSQNPADYSWRAYARMVAEMVNHVFPGQRVHGVGASMGAGTLLHAGVDKLIDLASLTLAIPPTAWATRAARSQGYIASAEFIDDHSFDAFTMLTAELPAAPATDPDAPVLAPDLNPDLAATVYRGAAISDLPGLGELGRLRSIPAQILAWTSDPNHPLSTASELASALCTDRLFVAEGPRDLESWPDLTGSFIRSTAAPATI